MEDPNHVNSSPTIQITGKIMVVAIIVIFFVVVVVLFIHLYAKWFWWRGDHQPSPSSHRRRRRRFVFTPGQDSAVTLSTGLAFSTLESIPVILFNPEEFKDGLECAVCLSELVTGDKARLLPKCNHGFHVDCIDMWFQSHATCPLCRNPVEAQSSNSIINMESREDPIINNQVSQENLILGFSTENPDFPTNVLFWGNETQISSAGASMEEHPSSSTNSVPSSSSSSSDESTSEGGMVMIDIPLNASENPSAASPTGFSAGELKSPVPTRLRSFKRFLSREKSSSSGTS